MIKGINYIKKVETNKIKWIGGEVRNIILEGLLGKKSDPEERYTKITLESLEEEIKIIKQYNSLLQKYLDSLILSFAGKNFNQKSLIFESENSINDSRSTINSSSIDIQPETKLKNKVVIELKADDSIDHKEAIEKKDQIKNRNEESKKPLIDQQKINPQVLQNHSRGVLRNVKIL